MPQHPSIGPSITILGDESRQTIDRFMILGGLVMRSRDYMELERRIEAECDQQDISKEIKWTKTSNSYVPRYASVLNLAFDLINSDAMHFRSLVVDNHRIDHRRYSEGDPELSFYKFYFQNLYNGIIRKAIPRNDGLRIRILLDQRQSGRVRLDALRRALDNRIAKDFPFSDARIVEVQGQDSRASRLLQVVDLILGATGYRINGHFEKPGASPAKVYLSRRLLELAGIKDPHVNTPMNQRRFAVWHLRLR